jgi:hypothetical protein
LRWIFFLKKAETNAGEKEQHKTATMKLFCPTVVTGRKRLKMLRGSLGFAGKRGVDTSSSSTANSRKRRRQEPREGGMKPGGKVDR